MKRFLVGAIVPAMLNGLPTAASQDLSWQFTPDTYALRSWTHQLGLDPISPSAILQRSDGILLFGSEAGSVYFDGQNFGLDSFTFGRHDFVKEGFVSAYSDRDGSLWFGISGGGSSTCSLSLTE